MVSRELGPASLKTPRPPWAVERAPLVSRPRDVRTGRRSPSVITRGVSEVVTASVRRLRLPPVRAIVVVRPDTKTVKMTVSVRHTAAPVLVVPLSPVPGVGSTEVERSVVRRQGQG